MVFVDWKGYKNCRVPKDTGYLRVYRTGHNEIQLPDLEPIHFISNMNNNCGREMRIQLYEGI